MSNDSLLPAFISEPTEAVAKQVVEMVEKNPKAAVGIVAMLCTAFVAAQTLGSLGDDKE